MKADHVSRALLPAPGVAQRVSRALLPAPRCAQRFVSRALLPALSCIVSCLSALAASPAASSTPLTVPANGRPGFTLLGQSQTALAFTNHLTDEMAALNQIRLIGSGVALGDVDGDGWCDIYLCRLEGPNSLYRNLGNWRFEESVQPTLQCADQYSTGCALADLDGDGDLDLLVNGLGTGTRSFRNDGQGRFKEDPAAGLRREGTGTTLALADVDGDGDLDLYVTQYRTTTIRSTGLTVLTVNGRHVLRPEDRDQYEFSPTGLILEHGEVDRLYLNDGQGQFSALPWKQGRFLDEHGQPLTAEPKEWGLSAMFRDVNGDRAPDLYVCNDFWSPDRFWINDGRGTFRAAPPLSLRKTSTFSMGVDFADINRDGHDDFLVLDMLSRDHGRRMRQRAMAGEDIIDETVIEDRPQADRNTLQLNRGDGTYAEIAQLSGLQSSDWSWSVAFVDLDLDGFEDVLVTTGHGFDTQDADTEDRIAAMGPLPTSKLHTKLLLYPRLEVPNYAFRNRGDLTFQEVGAQWGFNLVGVSHGLALADLDNDGDLDAVVNNLNQAVSLYRNESSAPRVAVRLLGLGKNRQGIGARLVLKGAAMSQSQEIIAGGRYLSSDAAERVFAMPEGQGPWALEVRWPGGNRTRLNEVQPNHRYTMNETAAEPILTTEPLGPQQPWFVEQPFAAVHQEQAFDDSSRQSLLPRQYDRLGPGIAWVDLDNDGWEDLAVAAGRGTRLGLFRNGQDGSFQRLDTYPALDPAPDDQTTVLGWPAGPGKSQLLVGTSNYEMQTGELGRVLAIEIAAGVVRTQKPLRLPGDGSPGPVAAADVDADGDLDLFVGGRIKPGRYPESVASALWLREATEWRLAQQWSGLVSGAVFTDLDGDGYPELVLACEWGPLRIFRRELEAWVELTQRWGFDQFRGWWNGVASGDFDGDGRLDIVASNWGRNHPYHSSGNLRIHSLPQGESLDVVEAYLDGSKWVPRRDLGSLSRAFPWLRERFGSHHAFSQATLVQVLDSHPSNAASLEANWLDSTLFLNRGDRFEARPLPIQAQFAPAFGICVADANGDGYEDLFLAQNFFAVAPQTSRLDAGRGLWLKGDGQGSFEPVQGQVSGMKVYGEQRGAAVADYDRDGRVDLVVGQTGAAVRLFRNVAAPLGLRVRLQGPPGNPTGAGAVMWWVGGERRGPAREVRLGGGYWSQDGAVQVLHVPARADELQIRWPGGRLTKRKLTEVTGELTVDWE